MCCSLRETLTWNEKEIKWIISNRLIGILIAISILINYTPYSHQKSSHCCCQINGKTNESFYWPLGNHTQLMHAMQSKYIQVDVTCHYYSRVDGKDTHIYHRHWIETLSCECRAERSVNKHIKIQTFFSRSIRNSLSAFEVASFYRIHFRKFIVDNNFPIETNCHCYVQRFALQKGETRNITFLQQ